MNDDEKRVWAAAFGAAFANEADRGAECDSRLPCPMQRRPLP